MRSTHGRSLCAALLSLLTIAESLSIHGAKHNHAHLHHHAGKSIAEAPAMTLGARDTTSGALTIELINNMDSDRIHAYIQTTDPDNGRTLLVNAASMVYTPVVNNKNSIIPQDDCSIHIGGKGSKVVITMPVDMIQGRIYIADGELDIGVVGSPSGYSIQNPTFQNPGDNSFNTSFGFIEANQDKDCLYVNPSYVDFVGIPLGVELVTDTETVGVSGLPVNGVNRVCEQLEDAQKDDTHPWSKLCLKDDAGKPVRVISPTHAPEDFSDYFDGYIDEVWTSITANGIKFDLQDTLPPVSCSVSGESESMICDRTPFPFPKPTSFDIWGCSDGAFAQIPDECHNHIAGRFCAGFHRATLLLQGGLVQPGPNVSSYYPDKFPHDKYSRIVHQMQTDHHGYTFAYDDVTPPNSLDVSGTLAIDKVRTLRITVGGLSSENGGQTASDSAPDASSSVQSSSAAPKSASSESKGTQTAGSSGSPSVSSLAVSTSASSRVVSTLTSTTAGPTNTGSSSDQPSAVSVSTSTSSTTGPTSTKATTADTTLYKSSPIRHGPALTESPTTLLSSVTSLSTSQEISSSSPGEPATARSTLAGKAHHDGPDDASTDIDTGNPVVTSFATAIVTQEFTQVVTTTMQPVR